MKKYKVNNNLLGAEESLVVLLSKNNLDGEEQELLIGLINTHMDWSKVLGLLQMHRLAAMAWENLKEYVFSKEGFCWKFSKLFRFCENIYNLQFSRMLTQTQYTLEVCKELDKRGINYVILKGIILSNFMYGDLALRESNDLDILIDPNQIDDTRKILKGLGYIQGYFDAKNKKIIPYSRKETLISPLVSHELRPFVKKMEVDGHFNLHMVDVQFSIDLLTGNRTDNIVKKLITNRIKLNLKGSEIYSLQWEDLLVYICVHFYKEATNLSEVLIYKDMLLYKLCDIFRTITNKDIDFNWLVFLRRVEEYDLKNPVYYSLYFTNLVYGSVPSDVLAKLAPEDEEYLDSVYQNEKLVHKWNDKPIERIFDMDRPRKIEELFVGGK